jgi:hypothetical protein
MSPALLTSGFHFQMHGNEAPLLPQRVEAVLDHLTMYMEKVFVGIRRPFVPGAGELVP